MASKRNRWDSDSEDSGDEERQRQQQKRKRKQAQEQQKQQRHGRDAGAQKDDALVQRGTSAMTPSSAGLDRVARHNFYLHGCRSVDNYARIGRIDEGTYGVVSKARDKETGEVVALKQVKMSEDVCHEGFPVTAMREANVLLALKHPNIISVREMVVGSTPDKIFMVMDYAENDLKAVMDTKMTQPFLQSEVKYLLRSLLRAIAYMHDHWYIHRDLKSSNLLYDSNGMLKVCDFGLARKYGSPIRGYTQLVVTLWYRAPELLLGATEYATAVDMWSVGCIFAEMLLLKPLFPGRGEIDQLDRIFQLLGTPSEEVWPGFLALPGAQQQGKWKWAKASRLRDKFPAVSSFAMGCCSLSNAGFDLLQRLLAFDPKQRISAADALKHDYFTESPLPKAQADMPIFPPST